MMLYLLKTITCSAILLLVYLGWLQQEKMHRFNRFYLLGSLAFSLLIPFISIETGASAPIIINIIEASETTTETVSALNNSTTEFSQTTAPVFTWYILLQIIYFTITILLFARFTRNLARLYLRIKEYKSVKYERATLILLPWATVPHSFLNYIFLSEESYKHGTIQKEIFDHELAHVKELHSLDIIIIELLQVLFWFNPFLIFYEKKIRINHEFLADDRAIKKGANVRAYQSLLLSPWQNIAGILPASSFNYSSMKKRLLMISKTTSPVKALLKKTTALLVASTLFLFCCIKTIAQDSIPKSIAVPDTSKPEIKRVIPEGLVVALNVPSTKEGVSEELVSEYDAILQKYKGKNVFTDISDADTKRLQTIFLQMSKAQQAKQRLGFRKAYPPTPRSVPTAQQVEAWKNPKKYGVWLNDKRIDNSVLNQYKAEDFGQFDISKLYGKAYEYQKRDYQVNIMTKEYYEAYRQKTLEENKKHPYRLSPILYKRAS